MLAKTNIKEYEFKLAISELNFYKHKSKQLFYVTLHRAGTPKMDIGPTEAEISRAVKFYKSFFQMFYLEEKLCFSDIYSFGLFLKLFGI